MTAADTDEHFKGPGPDAAYRAALKDGKMMIQRCNDCSRHIFYPRISCPHCGSIDLEQKPAAGTGTVYSTSIVRQKPEAGGNYNISLIDLTEGVRMMSRVVDIAPEEVQIGMAVRAKIGELGGEPAVLFEKA
ncbi:MAG TPA: Zn-ribbon domain-containing OB-fold protein [Burkholderiales bacterium]|nr:Zn-ribbon domain-containing OB-fold protein [Burkholderiales bacterium]